MRFMKDQDNAYRPLRSALIVAGMLSLSACGGSSSGGGSAGQLSAVEGQNFTVQSAQSKTYGVNASDSAGKSLTYTIKTPPKMGTATVNSEGTITYTAQNAVGSDSMVVMVSNGVDTKDVAVEIALQNTPVFDYQFYKVTNAETGNSQIVRYDPNDADPNSNQRAVKENVILGSQVFMMSGAKDDDAVAYTKREYAIFLDPNSDSETRTTTSGDSPVEYTFYKDNILKRFDADNPDAETVIFNSDMLTTEMNSAGINVIGSTVKTYLNEVDIDNSYVELRAFDQIPDLMKGEVESSKKTLPVTVRLSDSKVAAGRMIQPITSSADGTTQKVLLNYISASTGAGYEMAEKKLQVCEVDLSVCNDVSNGTGAYHYLAQNSGTIYMAKEGVNTLYALDKSAYTLAEVVGAEYPAEYDVDHHQISFGGGHGGAGIFSNFYNIANANTQLAEGDTSYLLINYNLDTQDAIGSGMFGENDVYAAKNAMLLKLTGNSGTTVYDNGSGSDLMNNSDGEALAYNLTLTAVKNGQVFVESSKFSPESKSFNYQQGWIDTDAPETATDLTNVVVDQTISYFTSIRVPAVAVGDFVYVNETNPLMNPGRVYNIYKMPIEDSSAPKPSVANAVGRMYFERSAYRTNGVYDGNVLLWDKETGDLLNATTDVLMGNILADVDSELTNVTADRSGNKTLAGVGGLFGLHMTKSHGEAPFLTSGSAGTESSLKRVNQIDGEWITD